MKHSWCDFLCPESFRSQDECQSRVASTNLIFCWADFRSAAPQSFWSSAAWREARDSSPQPGTRRGSTVAASSSGIAEINEDPGPGVLVGSASWATLAALRASVRTSSSAWILSSRTGWPSSNLKTTRCFVYRSDGSWRVRNHHAMAKRSSTRTRDPPSDRAPSADPDALGWWCPSPCLGSETARCIRWWQFSCREPETLEPGGKVVPNSPDKKQTKCCQHRRKFLFFIHMLCPNVTHWLRTYHGVNKHSASKAEDSSSLVRHTTDLLTDGSGDLNKNKFIHSFDWSASKYMNEWMNIQIYKSGHVCLNISDISYKTQKFFCRCQHVKLKRLEPFQFP